MKIKSLLVVVLFVLSVVASAAELKVEMSKGSRYSDGIFDAYSSDASVELIPANEEVVKQLDLLAQRAISIRGYVKFTVFGAVLSDVTTYHPRTGDNRTIKFLVHKAQ